jgi:hypothetical protein
MQIWIRIRQNKAADRIRIHMIFPDIYPYC